jgi:RNA polymerase sigma factor (sigma-70 family)
MGDLSPWTAPDNAGGTVARMALLQALDTLPARHRAAVILRYYHDYDYAAIAHILGTTPTNVGAMLSRALDRLRVGLDVGEPALPTKAVKP